MSSYYFLLTYELIKENDKNGKYLTSFGSNLGCKKLLLPKEAYFPMRVHLFEGIPLTIPNDAEQWLTNAYGEYMTFPPIEKRVNKHELLEVKV